MNFFTYFSGEEAAMCRRVSSRQRRHIIDVQHAHEALHCESEIRVDGRSNVSLSWFSTVFSTSFQILRVLALERKFTFHSTRNLISGSVFDQFLLLDIILSDLVQVIFFDDT